MKSTLVKLALEKFESSRFAPVKIDSYKFALINDDSENVPNERFEFIIMLLSKFTWIKLAKDRFEFGR